MATQASHSEQLSNMVRQPYGSANILQYYDSYDTARSTGVWIVFIHGGYFRDPKVDATSFEVTVKLLEGNETYRQRIGGYASINYRLSPHPSHPQPPDTPPERLNNARWPDQPNDIVEAIRHLQTAHPTAHRYILIGHSVGATLTFITGLRCSSSQLAIPRVLAGVSGIYDFPKIHQSHPEYANLTRNAVDEREFASASPALHDVDEYRRALRLSGDAQRSKILIAHSKDDGLVPWDQAVDMATHLEGTEFETSVLELHGEHNEIWQKDELSRAVIKALDMVTAM